MSEYKTNFQKVQEFNRAFDAVPKEPKNYVSSVMNEETEVPEITEFAHIRPELFSDDLKVVKLRLDLIREEISELNTAIKENDSIEIRDALSDILYVVYGFADVLGINIDDYYSNYIRYKESI